MEEDRSVFKILTNKKPKGKRRGRCRHRWKDNIRMIIKEKGANAKNWIDLTQNRV